MPTIPVYPRERFRVCTERRRKGKKAAFRRGIPRADSMETVAGSQVGEISRCLSGGSDVIALEALQWVAGPRPACAASAAGSPGTWRLPWSSSSTASASCRPKVRRWAQAATLRPGWPGGLGAWAGADERASWAPSPPWSRHPASAPRRRCPLGLGSRRPLPTWPRGGAPRGLVRTSPGGPGSRLPSCGWSCDRC